MAKRKADVFAGKGSFADMQRRRRIAIENGDLAGARKIAREHQRRKTKK